MGDIGKELKGMLNKVVIKLRDVITELEVQKISAAKHYQEEAKYHSSPTYVNVPPTRIIVDSLPALSDEEATYRKEKRARDGEHYFIEKLALIILAIYTLFTGVQTYLTRQSVENNKETLRQMRDASDANIIASGDTLIQMRSQTRAQRDAAGASQGALDTARRQFRLSERPWVEVGTAFTIWQPQFMWTGNDPKTNQPINTPIRELLKPGQLILGNFPFTLIAFVKNQGRSPALNVRIYSLVDFIAPPDPANSSLPLFQNVPNLYGPEIMHGRARLRAGGSD